MNKKIYIVMFLYLFSINSFSINIAPSKFVYNLSKGIVSQDVSLINKNSKPERIKIYFKPMNDDKVENDLSKWAMVYPKVININPGQEKIVKFAIDPPKNLENREYRGMIVFEELEDRALEFIDEKINKTGSGGRINFLVTMEVAIYGYTNEKEKLKEHFKILKDFKVNKMKQIELEIMNSGEISGSPKICIEYLDMNGQLQRKINDRKIIIPGKSEIIILDDLKTLNIKKIIDVKLLDSNSIIL